MTRKRPGNKELGTIFNNDINNILNGLDPHKPVEEIAADYGRALGEILEARPGVLAQNVGLPDPVIYPTQVATLFDQYLEEVHQAVWPDAEYSSAEAEAFASLLRAGRGPLTITIEACRAHGVPVVASYRMNAEDWYHHTYRLADFGRAHSEWRIPLPPEEGHPVAWAGCLDPAIPEVYQHRLDIFREVVENYDIDGLEFDFRRWYHMISNPLENHSILTKMVMETRQMLDEVAAKKGRERLLLGVRVGPSLDTPEAVAKYPGAVSPGADPSCQELGLDVKTWIENESVDYVCPTLFWPRWPGHPYTKEFAVLAQGRNVGLYPTLFPLPGWLGDENSPDRGPLEPEDTQKLQRYKDEICEIALKMYEDGADGISTFNWYFHLHLAEMPNQWQAYYGYGRGGAALQKHFLSLLGDPEALRRYQEASWVLPPPQVGRPSEGRRFR